MSRIAATGLALALGAAISFATPARAEEGTPPLPNASWSFTGPFGTSNRAALQRGWRALGRSLPPAIAAIAAIAVLQQLQ